MGQLLQNNPQENLPIKPIIYIKDYRLVYNKLFNKTSIQRVT